MTVAQHYSIDKSLVDKCIKKADHALYEKSQDYWLKCAQFVKESLNKYYEFFNYKQRNWLQRIIEETR